MPSIRKKASRHDTRIHNTRLVLRTVYEAGEISRADVARRTHLTRPTVSDSVLRLMEEGLVQEVGLGPSTGGKQPTLLRVPDNARCLIGIDLTGDSFSGALLNLRGKIMRKAEIPVNGNNGEGALQAVYSLLDELSASTPNPLLGIGISTPGLVDLHAGTVLEAVNLGWENLPLKELLGSRYSVPVFVTNDSQSAALAEYTFGEHEGLLNLVMLNVGRGIGAGIVLNGDLFYGDGFGAGEIGHVVVSAGEQLCTCGNRGCLEAVASTRAILSRAGEIASERAEGAQPPLESWQELVEAYRSGSPAAVKAVREAAHYIAAAVANLAGALNIEHNYISGAVTALGEPLLCEVKAELQHRMLPSLAQRTAIQYATLADSIGIKGSSAMVMKQLLGIF